MNRKSVNLQLSLTEQDRAALDDIFKTVPIEEIQEIEAKVARYACVPLEPWEETGWVINSLPTPPEMHPQSP
jgi:hypothetical protein